MGDQASADPRHQYDGLIAPGTPCFQLRSPPPPFWDRRAKSRGLGAEPPDRQPPSTYETTASTFHAAAFKSTKSRKSRASNRNPRIFAPNTFRRKPSMRLKLHRM
jgi:hypothetical protein